jgi:hypothetical protein
MSIFNWSTCQFVKLANGQLTELTNLVTFLKLQELI